ncbi:PREDICTED: uncharacterized protein LOC104772294 [Camelina sativa]|uniref:Uncharacterized protein LOC104772294 n=1 Tax=Camelina sativa TaxID=90675 RepID=A0ABM0Y4A0_CAMSA|nr:PREDICTED: uncharacterized protein LOC104772294 [Camelina sativa]
MGNQNSKGSSSTTNPKEEIAVAPRPQQQQPHSPLLILKPQPQQPLPPASSEMPLLHPCYKREDYENMSEEKIDMLLATYGIMTVPGDLADKRHLAFKTFCWKHNNNKMSDYVKPNQKYTDDWMVVNSHPKS